MGGAWHDEANIGTTDEPLPYPTTDWRRDQRSFWHAAIMACYPSGTGESDRLSSCTAIELLHLSYFGDPVGHPEPRRVAGRIGGNPKTVYLTAEPDVPNWRGRSTTPGTIERKHRHHRP